MAAGLHHGAFSCCDSKKVQTRKHEKVAFWHYFALSPFCHDNLPTQDFDLSTFHPLQLHILGKFIKIVYDWDSYAPIHNMTLDKLTLLT